MHTHSQAHERRAIAADEHQRIIEREHNPKIRAYYQRLWHLGGSQTDIAGLTAQDIDWTDRTAFCSFAIRNN